MTAGLADGVGGVIAGPYNNNNKSGHTAAQATGIFLRPTPFPVDPPWQQALQETHPDLGTVPHANH